jgi:hypothetical protein
MINTAGMATRNASCWWISHSRELRDAVIAVRDDVDVKVAPPLAKRSWADE